MGAQTIGDAGELYRVAVGRQGADYYAPKFLRFDRPESARISWNWAAFLVSFFWFPYRRMYGYWAVFCLLIPLALSLFVAIAGSALHVPRVFLVIDIAQVAYSFVLIPMIANGLYYRHVKRRIELLREQVPDRTHQLAVLQNSPHTSPLAFVLLAVATIPVFGIVAAIAIPAYQIYTVRSQVSQGLLLTKPLEGAISDYLISQHSWPRDFATLGITPPTAASISRIDLDNGTLSMTFGGNAGHAIAGTTLSLRPTLLAGRIDWACGYADGRAADPTAGAAGPALTDIDAKYLPLICRATQRPHQALAARAADALPASSASAFRTDEAPTLGAAPTAAFDIPDSMAVMRRILRMRRTRVQQLIRAGLPPEPPLLSHCIATILVDREGLAASDFPITCSDPRVTDVVRQTIMSMGTLRAHPGATVQLRINAVFPLS
jgi:type IV pilus assembly protein PilA